MTADGLFARDRQAGEVYSTLASMPGAADGSDATGMLEEAEIRYAVDQEMALHLEDVLFRRTGLAAGERPDEAIINRAADEMARICDWDGTRKREEIESVLAHFTPLSVQ